MRLPKWSRSVWLGVVLSAAMVVAVGVAGGIGWALILAAIVDWLKHLWDTA